MWILVNKMTLLPSVKAIYIKKKRVRIGFFVIQLRLDDAYDKMGFYQER